MTHYPIVLVDDLRIFLQPVPADAVVLRTLDEALAWLEGVTVEDEIGQLWLDHDLGKNDAGEIIEVKGFVRELEERRFYGTAPAIDQVFVHTSNPEGRRWILPAFQGHYRTLPVDAQEYFYGTGDDSLIEKSRQQGIGRAPLLLGHERF